MSEFSHTPKGEKRPQVLGVLLLGFGAFLFVCLLSHSPLDPPNSSRSVAESLNWGGGIGAYASYGAFAGMGLAAYVWPILLLLWGWNRVRCQPMASAVHRSVGLLLMAVLLSVATGLPGYSPQKAYELGGVLGTQISLEFLIPYLGRMGSAVLLSALFVVAVILTPGLNWRMLAWLGPGVAAVWQWLGRLRSLIPARQKSKAAKWERDQTAMVRETRSEIGAEPRVEDSGAPRKPMVEEVAAVEPRVQEPAPVERRERKKKKEPAVADVAMPGLVRQQEKAEPARKPVSGRYEIPSPQVLDEVPASQSDVSKDALFRKTPSCWRMRWAISTWPVRSWR